MTPLQSACVIQQKYKDSNTYFSLIFNILGASKPEFDFDVRVTYT